MWLHLRYSNPLPLVFSKSLQSSPGYFVTFFLLVDNFLFYLLVNFGYLYLIFQCFWIYDNLFSDHLKVEIGTVRILLSKTSLFSSQVLCERKEFTTNFVKKYHCAEKYMTICTLRVALGKAFCNSFSSIDLFSSHLWETFIFSNKWKHQVWKIFSSVPV